jgi:hypothetical protein
MALEVGVPRADGEEPERADERHLYRIFLLHHTHWDREWWSTFQMFRAQLGELIDDLLEAGAAQIVTVDLWF